MKAISLWQPWASLIVMGLKTYETRSWHTSYRGELLICAAKKKSADQKTYWEYISDEHINNPQEFDSLPFGCAIVIVNLTNCIKMTPQFINSQSEVERDCGDWSIGRFAWKLENIRRVENIPVKGAQGLFNVDIKSIKGVR